MRLLPQWLAIAILIAVSLPTGRTAGAQVEPWDCAPASTPSTVASPPLDVEPTPDAIPFPSGRVIIFAAASLTDAFTKIGEDIMSDHPDVMIQFNFAGSQTLVTQVQEGASADVLALASPEQMAQALESGIPLDDQAVFATNQLTIVVPADNPAGISAPEHLARDGVRLVLASQEVPAGAYARHVMCNIASATDMPDAGGFAARVVSEEDNVRSVLTKVQLGEADAGIVYQTDARAAGDAVRTIDIPAGQNVVARYPIASLNGDRLGAAFVAYVFSAEGQATLSSFGFGPVG